MLSAVFFGAFEKRPDVVIGTSPQFFAALGAWILSVLKWRPFIFELRDLWPASIVTVGAMKKGLSIRLLEKLELFLYRRATAVISVTKSFVDDLANRGIDRSKIHVVRNGVDLERYQPLPKSESMARALGVSDKFVVAYLGTHGMAHALDNVLKAASLLEGHSEIVFLLVGHGAQRGQLLRQATEMGLENVVFHDSMPKEKMPDLWSVSDIALVHLKDDPVFSTVIPSKIFEAFGMGKPVMIVQPDGEAVDIIRDAGAGVWVPPEDPKLLAAAVLKWFSDEQLRSDFARGSHSAAKDNSRDRLASEMIAVIGRAIGDTDEVNK
jgi:glycosyltransferase involved in cell wall biosynthesis